MLISDIIKAAIPSADESICEHILWGRTPFPMRGISAKELFKSASGFNRANKKGNRLCDWCHCLAVEGKSECQSCYDALNNKDREEKEGE